VEHGQVESVGREVKNISATGEHKGRSDFDVGHTWLTVADNKEDVQHIVRTMGGANKPKLMPRVDLGEGARSASQSARRTQTKLYRQNMSREMAQRVEKVRWEGGGEGFSNNQIAASLSRDDAAETKYQEKLRRVDARTRDARKKSAHFTMHGISVTEDQIKAIGRVAIANGDRGTPYDIGHEMLTLAGSAKEVRNILSIATYKGERDERKQGAGGKKKPKRRQARYVDPEELYGAMSGDGLRSVKSEDASMSEEMILSKSLWDFKGPSSSKGIAKLPDQWLADYVDAFIEEAWEHERRERSHTDPHLLPQSKDMTTFLATCVYNEFLACAPHNPNLHRALTFLKMNAEYVEARMRAMNFIVVDSENSNANNIAAESGYHGTPLALSMDQSLTSLSEQELQKARDIGFSRQARPEMVQLAPGEDPAAMLRKGLAGSVRFADDAPAHATVNPGCLLHGRTQSSQVMFESACSCAR
jgi:hypothetical protein